MLHQNDTTPLWPPFIERNRRQPRPDSGSACREYDPGMKLTKPVVPPPPRTAGFRPAAAKHATPYERPAPSQRHGVPHAPQPPPAYERKQPFWLTPIKAFGFSVAFATVAVYIQDSIQKWRDAQEMVRPIRAQRRSGRPACIGAFHADYRDMTRPLLDITLQDEGKTPGETSRQALEWSKTQQQAGPNVPDLITPSAASVDQRTPPARKSWFTGWRNTSSKETNTDPNPSQGKVIESVQGLPDASAVAANQEDPPASDPPAGENKKKASWLSWNN